MPVFGLRQVARRVPVLVIVAAALVPGVGGATPASSPTPRVRPVSLPRDHGAHPGYRGEWWYTAGLLSGPGAHPYFWFATAWAAPIGVVARVNVVDLRADRIVLAREYLDLTPAHPGQTTIRAQAFSVRWRRGGAYGRWSITAPAPAGALSLGLRPGQPYLLHGRGGVIQQGRGGPSAYYSEPRLLARGTLELGARRIAVHGLGWLDHQWGNFAAHPDSLRWNWFACQFADGGDLMLYQFLNQRDRPSGVLAGTFTDGRGKVVHLHRFTATGLAPFVRPAGATVSYPLRWRLRVPDLHLTLGLRARARHQFIVNQLIPSFWEGAAAITSGAAGGCIVESSREVPASLPGLAAR